MTILLPDDHTGFPDPSLAGPDGLLAVGGRLEPETLIMAYSKGIFPWYGKRSPLLWWSPDPRMILYPRKLAVSKSLRQSIRNRNYRVRFDTAFDEVIARCAGIRRKHEQGTWITPEIIRTYTGLHEMGLAHSVETFENNRLAGGLYGVSLGKAFFGESMFHVARDASKVALFYLVNRLLEWDFHFIDAQVETLHMRSMGAEMIPRVEFLELLDQALAEPTIRGKW